MEAKGYLKAIHCKVDPTVIYLARVKVEEDGIKFYYNCSRDAQCDAKDCVFKKYMEKEIEVEFFGMKSIIDEYKDLIKNELRRLSKYPVKKIGVWVGENENRTTS